MVAPMPEDPPDSRRRPLTSSEQEQVAALVPWARSIAWSWAKRVPRHIDVEDLASAAYVALCQAARDFSPTHGASFKTYAAIRVNGAIRDNLRLQDWMSRGVREDYTMFWGAYGRLTEESQDIPSPDEVLDHLGVTDPRRRSRILLAASTNQSSLEHLQTMFEVQEANPVPDPSDMIAQDDLTARIHAASLSLPPRHLRVYQEVIMGGRSQTDLSEEMGVTPARVNQMVKEVGSKIRRQLEQPA
jgi:RNA polymerase sigma factor FliA